MAVIENELRKMPKSQKSKFNEIMMSGNGMKSGGFLGSLLASIGIPMILKPITGSGLHNRPYDVKSYKIHKNKIPIPQNQQPIVKQNEGTALNEWELYNPPPFNDNHEIIEGKGIKKR